MERIPCIKCDSKLWEYLKPYLKEWGYVFGCIGEFEEYQLLIINYKRGKLCTNVHESEQFDYNRELVTDVEEFLERAAKLKGFTYKRKDIMKINGIEIKAGMILTTSTEVTYIVFPSKNGLAGVNYHEEHTGYNCWYSLKQIIDNNEIVIIRDAPKNQIYDGNILWEKPKEVVLTMDDIAKKFEVPVEQLRIKK